MSYRRNPTCLDCGIPLRRGIAIRCRPCESRRRAVPPPRCPDCGDVVSDRGYRCRACATAARRGVRQLALAYVPVEAPALDLTRALAVGIPFADCATSVTVAAGRLVVSYEEGA